MKVSVGGTFDIIHDGHKALLARAFEIGNEVIIGLSSDDMAARMGKEARSYGERKRNLEEFLRKRGWEARIEMLKDEYGTTLQEDFDAIVVSPETRKMAEIINEKRRKSGMKTLQIVEVPYVLANDGIPVASRRIRNGEIEGKRRVKPLRVCVVSKNEIKMEAVRNVFSSLFHGIEAEYEMLEFEWKKQPSNEEIMEGAKRRAMEGAKRGDYGVGIESGIRKEGGIYFIEQYVVVADKIGYMTYGKSPAFECPGWLLESIKKGREMREAIPFESEEERKKGAIWYLSRRMDRRELTEQGVLMAMVPRIRAMKGDAFPYE